MGGYYSPQRHPTAQSHYEVGFLQCDSCGGDNNNCKRFIARQIIAKQPNTGVYRLSMKKMLIT